MANVNEALQGLRSIPGSVGAALVLDGQLLGRALPEVFRDERITSAVRLMNGALMTMRGAGLSVKDLRADFEGGSALLKPLPSGRSLLVIGMRQVNESFLRMAIDMVSAELDQATAAIATGRNSGAAVPPARALNDSTVNALARLLAFHVGPAARVLVARAQTAWLAPDGGAPDTARLIDLLAAEIDTVEGKKRFREESRGVF